MYIYCIYILLFFIGYKNRTKCLTPQKKKKEQNLRPKKKENKNKRNINQQSLSGFKRIRISPLTLNRSRFD